ncbi:hypothetical protein ACFQJC_01565 [Haloferax namakaokahaiae]|uniref:CopG family transcriptional regulator n=1 Tax=Haloferax namakaokahaiae TaxID=1748331 RepID=A0ABD5ZAI3_9EURY
MAVDTGGSLPDDLREWLDAYADETGEDADAILARAVGLYRLTVSETAGEGDVASLADRLDALESELSEAESEFDDKIDDVRMRVVQVKREADDKAPREHTHPELTADIDDATRTVEALREQVERLDEYVDGGFENYEEVLTYLDETTTDLETKLQTVAKVLVDLRARTVDIEAEALERETLAELLRVANANNDRKATCESCETKVHLDLLAEPRCPACRTAFTELSPSSGFFGSATLHTGPPPALTGTESDDADVEEILEAVAEDGEEVADEVEFRYRREETAMTDGEGDD